jgi:hypothetical protein
LPPWSDAVLPDRTSHVGLDAVGRCHEACAFGLPLTTQLWTFKPSKVGLIELYAARLRSDSMSPTTSLRRSV